MCAEDVPRGMGRGDFLRVGGAGLAGAVLLGTAVTGGRALAQAGPSLEATFDDARARYGVPKPLLKAMGYVNTMWEMPPPGATDFEPGDLHGHGTYGIMQLYQNPERDTLGRAASLTRLSEEEIKTDRAANVRGGAAVLASMADPQKPSDLDDWREAVAEYGGIDLYAEEVFRTLREGAAATISTGERLRLAPRDVEVPVAVASRAATDYGGAEWRGADRSNYSARFERERDVNIDRLIIHVVQGSLTSAINTFQNPSSDVSAHYVVGSEGRVVQCVRHEDVAWHAGNWSYNKHSIGIEHGGYADNPNTWPKAKYRASAKLAAYCCRRHNIPVDQRHIIGHKRVPGTDHYCPGTHFDHKRYRRLIRRFM
ncbi:MAG TPA: peptidoglycan recognition family protein [Rubrobacter sp.]|nr:peptidoglycan recognition family protein [Rubrobacter sp.]